MPLTRHTTADITWWQSPLLSEADVPHAFVGRDVDATAPATVRDRLLVAAGMPNRELIGVHQIHGCDCLDVSTRHEYEPRQQADALCSHLATQALVIRTADCVPVLFSTADGRWVAAAHAGWRGLVGGVLTQSIACSPVPPEELIAAIGPCIGSGTRHFEVGPEVADAFREVALEDAIMAEPSEAGKPCIDLARATELALTAAGIQKIDAHPPCTYQNKADFFSHRRDVTHLKHASTGRLASIIGAALTQTSAIR